jgi:hypothetical protein
MIVLTGLVTGLLVSLSLTASAWADTIPVTTTANSGAGSLREAIIASNADTDLDVVDATGVSGTIVLSTALPGFSTDIVIRGPGASRLTVARIGFAPPFRIFRVNDGANATISGLTITNGDGDADPGSGHGGGLLLDGDQGSLTVANSVVTGNRASDGGGGISNGGPVNNGATLVVRNSTVSGNTASFGGGGIESAFGEMTVRNSTVSGNTAGFLGGGIAHRGTGVIHNTTVSGNQADTGGGIGTGGTDTVLAVRSSTVSSNSAAEGANLRNTNFDPVATLRSTILANPRGGGRNCFVDDATLTSNGYNLASDASCKLTKPTDQPSTNPKLAPLASNGGATRTMALLADSPALDRGIAAGVKTDQRGRGRPVAFPWIPDAPGGDGADIGAFEVQSLTPPESPSSDFRFGKVKKNKRKGTAKLTVIVPGAGELDLAKTKKVKPKSKSAEGEGEEKLAIKSKGKSKRKLRRSGKARVRAEVTYTPSGGEPNTKTKKLKLKKRR